MEAPVSLDFLVSRDSFLELPAPFCFLRDRESLLLSQVVDVLLGSIVPTLAVSVVGLSAERCTARPESAPVARFLLH
jgi:hypothetical protein